MQEPGFLTGSRLSPSAPRKSTRRRRTVFSAQQRRVLEEFFEGKPYGTYEERETLAARLNLWEYQAQVWLKNRRAKDRRLQRLRGQQGQRAHAAPQEPGVCAPQPAPVPAPAGPASPVLSASPVQPATSEPSEEPVFPAGPVLPTGPVFDAGSVLPAGPVFPAGPGFPAGPVFPAGSVLPAGLVLLTGSELPAGHVFPARPVLPAAPLHYGGPGFCSLPPHRPLQVFPPADPSASSYSQACWDPAQGVQSTVPAAPAPDPAPAPASAPDPNPGPAPTPDPAPSEATLSPQGPEDAGNFSPDPDFTDPLSPYCSAEEPFSSLRSWYDLVGDSHMHLFQLLDLPGGGSPPSPADAGGPDGTQMCAHPGARSAGQCVSTASCSPAESAHF